MSESSESSAPHAPRTLGGYVLEEKLGQGGMGSVFRARHPAFPGVAFAVKVLAADSSPDRWARFEREMQMLAALRPHRNLVRIHGGKLEGSQPYYVMELVEGPSLEALVARGPLEPRRAVTIVRAVADAVAHIHAQGIVHRDLKPGNVLMEADDTPRLCDFGLARSEDANRLTAPGTFLGTVFFAAPEQLRGGAREADERADVYALGGLLWFALVGRAPFQGDSLQALISRVLTTDAERPSAHAPRVDARLDAICARALSKKAIDRQPMAAVFRDDLDRWLAGGDLRGARSPLRALRLVVPLVLLVALVAFRQYRARTEVTRRIEAALGESTAAAVEAERDALLARGAAVERLEPLRARVAELAAREAGAPGAPLETLRASVARLERVAASEDARLEVRARICERLALDASRAPAPESAAHRREYAAAALACAARVNLVGEAGSGPTTLELLCEPGAPALLDAATAIVDARLRAHMDDPAARALRAYVGLARLRAPLRPLGEGTLELPRVEESLLDDLARARSIAGAPGARAAWLLVDVLCALGAPSAARLPEALEAAAGVAGAGPEAALLTEVAAAAPPASDRAVALFARHRKASAAGDALAPFALARLLALWGAPSAVEHPELSREKRSAAIDALVRAEGVARFRPIDSQPGDAAAVNAFLAALNEELGRRTNLGERVEPSDTAPRARKILAAALVSQATSEVLLSKAGDLLFDRLSRCVFLALTTRANLDIYELVDCYYAPARDLTRAVSKMSYGPHWDVPWQGFDAALAEDVGKDELLRVAQANGLPHSDVARAIRASEGLRRSFELADADANAPDEPRVAFEALVRLEDLARLGGPTVLPFRARLRRLALPGPLGDALAALDLERALAVVGEEKRPLHVEQVLLLAAAYAAQAPEGSLARQRAVPLLELGVAWFRAVVAMDPELREEGITQRQRENRLAELLSRLRDRLRVRPDHFELTTLRGNRIDDDFSVTADDRDKLSKPKEFTAPRLRSRP